LAKRDIIVIGGSAGSNEPIRNLIRALPDGFPASLFITTHIPATYESYLPELLRAKARIPVHAAVDGQPIECGHAYVAVADRHLLLIDSTVRLGLGPRENMARPSIDPMFRSAALSYGSRAVGVILSGMMNDGASGLFAIKQAGGTAVVQQPLDALRDDMPRAALEATDADYVAPAADMAGLLTKITALDAGPTVSAPESLLFEVQVAAGVHLGSQLLRRFAEPAPITCPDCGGVLSQVRGQHPLRYRCQIGHAYTAEELAEANERVDEAVRIAMRVMEERVELVERMADDARNTGRWAVAELYDRRAAEYRRYAATLREATVLSLRRGREADQDPVSSLNRLLSRGARG
jgi:two-component system chemotaxis response regulator CheB